MTERRRAVALAHHFREAEGLSIAQIAERLGRSPATVKAYFYDPTGEKARAVKARYVGVCRGCGAYTQPRNGKGDAYAYCKRCHPGAIERRWTRERVLVAIREWRSRYGKLPSSDDWSRTHAHRRGERRGRDLPAEDGRPRAWSAACSEPGPPRGRPRSARTWPHRRRAAKSRSSDWSHRRFVCPIASNRSQNPRVRGGATSGINLAISRAFR